MATFLVSNISGSRLAVPPPLDVILQPGASANVEASSADTDALADLQDRNLIKIVQLTSGLNSDATDGATIGHSGAVSTNTIGTIGAPIVLAAGETMTYTHDLGTKASTIDVYDSDGANFTADADIAVAQASANALAVTSTAGGSFVVVVSFDASVENLLSGAVPQDDSHIAVA